MSYRIDEMHLTERMGAAVRGLHLATRICHEAAVNSGWWSNPRTGDPIKRNRGEIIALMHCELSEALEADRKSLMDDKLPHRIGVEVELADLLIRVFDFAGAHDLDLAGAMVEKLAFNAERAYHKLENRVKPGGKAY